MEYITKIEQMKALCVFTGASSRVGELTRGTWAVQAKRAVGSPLLAILLALVCPHDAIADWSDLYYEPFDSDPAWTSNNPSNYSWDGPSQTYFVRQINGSAEYSYKTIPGLLPGASWRVEFKIRPGVNTGAGNRRLSLSDPDMQVGEGAQGQSFITLDFNNTDDQIQLLWSDATTRSGYIHIAPNGSFTIGTWYTAYFEWDAPSGTLSAGVRVRSTGQLVGVNSVSGVGPFIGIDRITMSTLGDSLGGTGEAKYDDIVVKQDAGPLAWWRMEDRQGTTIPDASGHGHTLTIHGNPTFVGPAVGLNGNGFLDTPDADDLDLLGDWTISSWVWLDDQQFNLFIQKVKAFHDDEGGWAFGGQPGLVQGTVYKAVEDNWDFYAYEDFSTSQWRHVAMSFARASDTFTIYLDGTPILQSQSDLVMRANSYPVVLGGYLQENGEVIPYCRGQLADVRIYGRVLAAGEIAQMHATGDCNGNLTLDSVEILEGLTPDCNTNGVPDDCEEDFDGDGVIDICDSDVDNDGVPNETDVCDYTPPGAPIVTDPQSPLYGTLRGDLDGDCDVDLADYAIMQAEFTGPN